MMNPAPQMPHFVRPENWYCGRFAAPTAPAVFIVCRVCFWRDFAAVQISSGTIRSCGTSRDIHSDVGLSRDTRFPVSGFFWCVSGIVLDGLCGLLVLRSDGQLITSRLTVSCDQPMTT